MKQRRIFERYYLRVFDAEAPVIRTAEYRRVCIQHRSICPVADRMRIDLKPVGHRIPRDSFDVFFLQDQQAGIAGIVRVRLLQRGAARAKRAIGHQLDAADG